LTWRIDFVYFGSTMGLYRKLRRAQPVNHGAYLSLPDRVLLSLSPELFLKRCGDTLIAKPMKGTLSRAADSGVDQRMAEVLERSEKDRAENLMIVDLIRNDLGKIAQTGSVKVDQLFSIEEYPSVYQMVSRISARVPDRSLFKTLKALFPSGSVTGAPKIRAMEIINDLEWSPRGIYTGTIGHIKPGGDFTLNVAIRTIELKRENAHLKRLKESAEFFGFKYCESSLREALASVRRTRLEGPHRVRLTLEKHGRIDVRIQPLVPLAKQLSFVLAPDRTDSGNLLLRHKTTARILFDDVLDCLKPHPGCFDALFFNERDELTEGAGVMFFW